ncbi:MAG: hypothetical protein ACKVZ0_12640 [Gemmatimonadales bacterium]
MTAKQALIRGHLAISLPILAVFAAAIATPARGRWLSLVGFLGCYAFWSVAAPRWRLWALANVTDTAPASLLERGAKAGLLWREGSWFQRTEFRPGDYPARQARAALLGAARGCATDLTAALQDDWGANALEEIQVYLRPLIDALAAVPRNGEAERAAVGAFAAQFLVAQQAGVLGLSKQLERRGSILAAALDDYWRAYAPTAGAPVAV